MKTSLPALVAAVALLAAPAMAQEKITFKVIGQPLGHRAHPEEQGAAVLRNAGAEDGAADRGRLQADRHARRQGHRAAPDDEVRPVRDRVAARVAELARRADAARPRPRRSESGLRDRPPDGEGVVPAARRAPAEAVRRQAPGHLAVRTAGAVLQEADHQARRRQGTQGPRLRPEPREVHLLARGHAGRAVVPRDPPVAVAGRGRLRDHRRELGELGRLARGVDASAADRLPGGAQCLRGHAEVVEPAQARPAGQAPGRVRRADRGRVEVFRGAVPSTRSTATSAATRARPGRSSSSSTCR